MLYGLFFLFTAKNGNGVSTFTDSLRVAITTEPVGTDGKAPMLTASMVKQFFIDGHTKIRI